MQCKDKVYTKIKLNRIKQSGDLAKNTLSIVCIYLFIYFNAPFTVSHIKYKKKKEKKHRRKRFSTKGMTGDD